MQENSYQTVGRLIPEISDTNNNLTFPAVSIQYDLPTNMSEEDPWTYIDNLYTFWFLEGLTKTKTKGIPCDKVEGYSETTLK